MKASIPNYYPTVDRLKERSAELQTKVVAALDHGHACQSCAPNAARTCALVAARLLLAAQGLIKALDGVSFNVSSSNVDLGELPVRKPKTSLEEVLILKDQIQQAWGAINFYGPDALRRSQPEYFNYLHPLTEGLLGSVESAIAGKLHDSVATASSPSAHELSFKAHCLVRVLHTRIKRARGGRRGNLTLAICLLDDVENLARACTLGTSPTERDDDRKATKLEKMLKQADAHVVNAAAVGDATTAVLMPLAQQLFNHAGEICPEVTEASKEGIAFLD